MDVCCDCFVLSGRGFMRRANHPSRGVLPSVVCVSGWSWSLLDKETLADEGLLRHGKKLACVSSISCSTVPAFCTWRMNLGYSECVRCPNIPNVCENEVQFLNMSCLMFCLETITSPCTFCCRRFLIQNVWVAGLPIFFQHLSMFIVLNSNGG